MVRQGCQSSLLTVACSCFFFFNDTATTEIYTRSIVGSVRCVQETGINAEYMGAEFIKNFSGRDSILESVSFGINDDAVWSKEKQVLEQKNLKLEKELEMLRKKANRVHPIMPVSPLSSSPEIQLRRSSRVIAPKSPHSNSCLLYTSPSPRDLSTSRMPSSA
eukprot:TRINITY_DN25093_c0_g1_i2.p1 TRINITY_DN25093_c0_g1~~TRINITY_DN25093_c0_g1_i2.p1  ORF type:complete len:162 (+),score=38.31 TRINITY_DN25093_c0_g1_i2:52-537(+)